MPNPNDANNNEENDTSQDSSDQNQTSDDSNLNASEGADEAKADDSKTQGDDDSGNPSAKFQQRFDTIYGEKKEAERRTDQAERRADQAEQELKEIRAGKTNEDDDTPPQTWEEAETRLLAKIKSEEDTKAQKEIEIENEIEKEIQTIIKIDSDVKADDVWAYMEKKNISNPYQAYTQMKHEEPSDNSENKETSSKIGSNSQSSQGGKKETSYAEIHNTPLDDI